MCATFNWRDEPVAFTDDRFDEARLIGIIAKRPIANAAWKELHQQPGMYQSYAKEYTDRFRMMGLRLSELGYNESERGVCAY